MSHDFIGTPFVSSENLKRFRAGSLRSSSLQSQGKVIAWLIDNDGSEQCDKGSIYSIATVCLVLLTGFVYFISGLLPK